MMAIEYLITSGLVYQPPGKVRFFKGAHTSYAMLPPNHVKDKELSIKALAKLNLNIDDYVQIWQQCLLPTLQPPAKMEKAAINHIKLHLNDYISFVHRLGNATDPVAQEILKPGLYTGQIGIDFDLKSFSLASEHMIHFDNDDDVMNQISRLCIGANDEKVDILENTTFSVVDRQCIAAKMSHAVEISMERANDDNQLQAQQSSSVISVDISSTEYDQTNTLPKQDESTEKGKFFCTSIHVFISHFNRISFIPNTAFMTSDFDNNSFKDCAFILEKIKTSRTLG